MRIRNYTAHPIILVDMNTKREVTYDPVYEVRILSTVSELALIKDETTGLTVPLLEFKEQEVTNAPVKMKDTLCIVSSLVAAHTQSRDDFVSPSKLIRGEGWVKKARALAKPRPGVT